jgi:CDP-diacylglycerol--glycerol-3-phosphate 3-phosphatidyltransferase
MISNSVTALRIVLLAPLAFFLSGPQPQLPWAALIVFLLAGFTDAVDGRLARALNEVSRFGAMLDLIADRLLTLVVVLALIASGELHGLALIAGLVLVARDMVVASFGEAVVGLNLTVTPLERVKITLQFLGFGLLIAPPLPAFGPQRLLGHASLELSAVFCFVTVASYARRTILRLQSP